MFSAYLEYAEYEYNISFLKFECHLAIDIGAPKLNKTILDEIRNQERSYTLKKII